MSENLSSAAVVTGALKAYIRNNQYVLLPVLYTENRESDRKTMYKSHISVSLVYHHPCSVSIYYICCASLFENILLSHLSRIQKNMLDSGCTRIKDSSYLFKGTHTEEEEQQYPGYASTNLLQNAAEMMHGEKTPTRFLIY